MEIGQSQELEMTEAAPKVYDIIHPTPVSLKELSAMAISLELWRYKVNEYRTGRKLEKLNSYRLRIGNTRRKSILPDLPSTIYETIEFFFSKFVSSVLPWLFEHYKQVFSCFSHENYVLEYFDDFVCDYDGSVHYVRTAERMMRCELLTKMMKFTIACTYFFEDDIRRIWPSVSRHLMNVDLINFYSSPQLYYWICRLTNQLCKMPNSTRPWFSDTRLTVDERMFDAHMPYNRPSLEYFWNRIPVEKQMERAQHLDGLDFVRFILPKLNDSQLDKFVNNTRSNRGGFHSLFRYRPCEDYTIVLKIWSYIRSKNIMNKSTFTDIAVNLMRNNFHNCVEFDHKDWEYVCGEIWNDTPLDFKQSVIRHISSESEWLENMTATFDYHRNQIHVEFLLLILQDASIKERNLFWRNCWSPLIEAVRTKDLQRIAQLCFKSHNEITQFKQNCMINSEVVLQVCVSLFYNARFDELNAFLSFFHPESESQTARNFKEQILESAFLGENCRLSALIIYKIEEFIDIVKDVSTDFKNLLISSPLLLKSLSSIICADLVSSKTVIKFIDTLVSTEETVMQVKMSLTGFLKERIMAKKAHKRALILRGDMINSILLWCLGSDEGVDEFISTCIS
ncbi:uncharacterized protein LOC135848084 [Planococcus citri]|uniref:uncharacterized protein LOC135848084 n=1 Tax=Planococcus citri TaxID=170843 RepID=UPI0031F88054